MKIIKRKLFNRIKNLESALGYVYSHDGDEWLDEHVLERGRLFGHMNQILNRLDKIEEKLKIIKKT